MGGIDLHAHSNYSDGTFTPAELVALAAERGLEAVALTDHDTAEGLPEALRAGAEVGKYQVALLAPEGAGGEFWKLVPKEYAEGQMLSAEVKEGMPPLTLKVDKLKGK